MGYFLAEKQVFEEIRRETGMTNRGKTDSHVRYPLTFLMEAADDIAYATSDLEDGLKKGMFTVDEFLKYVQNCLKELPQGEKKSKATELFKELFTFISTRSRNTFISINACQHPRLFPPCNTLQNCSYAVLVVVHFAEHPKVPMGKPHIIGGASAV